jgi:hypothetical protein
MPTEAEMKRSKRWTVRQHIRFHEAEVKINVKLARSYARAGHYREAGQSYIYAANHETIAAILRDATRGADK